MTEKFYNLRHDAPRYVVEALSKAGPQSVWDLAEFYDPPKPNDLAEIRADIRSEKLDGREQVTNREAKEWLIEGAIGDINADNEDYEIRTGKLDENGEEEVVYVREVLIEDSNGKWWLADGVDVNKLVWRKGGWETPPEPLFPKRELPNLFGPSGLWRENIRAIKFDPDNDKDDRELLDLMRENGWERQYVAEVDEHGVWLTGHRRKAAADILKEEGVDIEYVTHVQTYGDDEAGEARRAKVALGSNAGVKPFSAADRRKIAADLYGTDNDKWTTTSIAKLLNVSAMTISRDLSGFNIVKDPSRGGRPGKSSTPQSQPQPGPTPREQAAAAVGVSVSSVGDAKARKEDAPDLAEKVRNGDMSLHAATEERKKRRESNPNPALKQPTDLRWNDEDDIDPAIVANVEAAQSRALKALNDLRDIVTALSAADGYGTFQAVNDALDAIHDRGVEILREFDDKDTAISNAVCAGAKAAQDDPQPVEPVEEQAMPVTDVVALDGEAVEKAAQRIIKLLTDDGPLGLGDLGQKFDGKTRKSRDPALGMLVRAGTIFVNGNRKYELAG